jgi:hypothetical protein
VVDSIRQVDESKECLDQAIVINFSRKMLHHRCYDDPEIYLGYEKQEGHAVAEFVEALCYKPEGHRCDSR